MMTFQPELEDVPRLLPLLQAFLSGEIEETNEDLVAHLSLMEDTTENRLPPTNDQLLNLELKWGPYMVLEENPPESEKCIICLQSLEPSSGVIKLSCNCNNYFHRKCMIEWFYFNEREDNNRFKVSCPSCRHTFEEE